MKTIRLVILIITMFINYSKSWEYCLGDVRNKMCELGKAHLVCDAKDPILKPSDEAKKFLAHVPMTRKVKQAFLNWHNYYRNHTAGGWAKNRFNIFFPKAVRMRELIWDNELSYLSHFRTKLVSLGDAGCLGTQRFANVGQNLEVAFNDTRPVLEIIALSLRKMFDEKNNVENPNKMPKEFMLDYEVAKQFTTMVNDRVSRLGCAVALGSDCKDNLGVTYKFCYYTACLYDYAKGGVIYKVGRPTGRCSRWHVGKSKTYINLCANSGEIFDPNL